jgi:amidase
MADATNDPEGAFVPGPRVTRSPAAQGPLSGLSFAVKDLYDIAGEVTSYGNPDWARTHPPAAATAPVVLALLEAGGALAGKTKTVELAYGLTGENIWHGTPRNPAAPDRFPGGSSCGSAAAVAGRRVDFALGSDTGGSVRIPASYCGLYGIRPSHGALSLAGVAPLAPSLDVAGWFARDAQILACVGAVLLPGGGGAVRGPLLWIDEVWGNAQPEVADALRPAIARLEQRCGAALRLGIAPEGLATVYQHFRAVQAQEAWAALGDWITVAKPRFGPGVGERFAAARAIDPAAAQAGRAFRVALQARIRPLLTAGAVMVYPTSPCPAPLLTTTLAEQDTVRAATLGVTALAGLCGLPEVTLPVVSVAGAPVGLSLVGGTGTDRSLLDFARIAADTIATH